jgi:hypothetical protein
VLGAVVRDGVFVSLGNHDPWDRCLRGCRLPARVLRNVDGITRGDAELIVPASTTA